MKHFTKAEEEKITKLGTQATLNALMNNRKGYISAIKELANITGVGVIEICYELTQQAFKAGFKGYEKQQKNKEAN